MARKKVDNQPHLERDMNSQAIINTNKNAFVQRRLQKAEQIAREEEFQNMKNELEELKKIVKKLSK
jgi:hypothetical protein|tara:strand:+ start:333 stop:530 length:198 start_codon:yes stop_codon:yes gene_type:complete